MRITGVKIRVISFVETDEKEHPVYKRSSFGIWENLIGESWEPCSGDDGELEAAYQAFVYKDRAANKPMGG